MRHGGYGLRVGVTDSAAVEVIVAVGVRVGVTANVGVAVGVAVGGTGRNVNCHEARTVCAGSDDGHRSVLMPVASGRAD